MWLEIAKVKAHINIARFTRCSHLLDDSASYSVRILELDSDFKKDCVITAKPYIVLEKDGVEITVYGEIQSATYNSVLNG